MKRYLVIVESPTKIKTLKRFLGSEYTFASSIGHIRDLPEKKYGISIEKHSDGSSDSVLVDYEVLSQKKEVVKNLIKEAKKADLVYLCPDPDREGEAIAWHLRQLLPENIETKRVTFNSITKSAVTEAIASPREIDIDLVNAQQARRILDRIVGYSISPILVQRVQLGRRGGQGALSAGRVQSVALKLVVDREKEISSFKNQEYWNITSKCLEPQSNASFRAQLSKIGDAKVVTPSQEIKSKSTFISNEAHAKEIEQELLELSRREALIIEKISRQERKRHPVAPFITSTLQQEASRHFGFTSQRTMNIAQTLYEGVEMGNKGAEGLITYMRTDSVRISSSAQENVRRYIKDHHGPSYLPKSPRLYNQKKSAQDAHEAIRPTNLMQSPKEIQPFLSSDQFKLYSLIFNRFVASQMESAIYDTVSIIINGENKIELRANGNQLKFPGFLVLYQEKLDDQDQEHDILLPNLQEKQSIQIEKINLEQAFTKPPPRYTEASLVKALEESGIGRPSTYASIMNKIQSRSYTVKEKLRLKPTLLGQITTELLENYFEKIINLNFTANMENDLEKVAENDLNWQKLIIDFWNEFEPVLKTAKESAHVPKNTTDYTCPKCEKGNLQKIWAGQSYFLGCENYPDCDYKASIEEYEFDKSPYSDDFDWEQLCPKCESTMKIRNGPYGAFLGCNSYPECKGLVQIPLKGESEQLQQTSACVAVGCTGSLRARRSRFGKIFYSCSEYPACDVIASTLDEVNTKYINHPKTEAAQKKKAKTTKKTATTKKKRAPKKVGPVISVSPALEKILKEPCHSRMEITKQIWVYIKENKLQDPNDGRYILCNEDLKAVLGEDRVYMTAIAKAISSHLL